MVDHDLSTTCLITVPLIAHRKNISDDGNTVMEYGEQMSNKSICLCSPLIEKKTYAYDYISAHRYI